MAAILVLGTTIPAFAETSAEFYKGRDVRLLIGAAAGGGYDIYGRFFARHLPDFLPGKPHVIVENLPSAGGLAMENTLYAQAPRDGSVIAHADGALVTADLFGVPGARFKAQELTWIGSLNSEVGVSISWHTSPVKTAADLMKHKLIVGGTAANSANVIFPTAMNNLLGTKFKIVPGYTTTATIAAAIERGEVEGTASWHYSSIVTGRPDWLNEHKINLLIQLSLKRHPALPDVPTVIELAHNDEDRAVLELIFAQQQVGRPILAPPKVPRERAEALRGAFKTMISDSAVLQEAKSHKIEINQPMLGDEIQALVDRLHAMPAAVVKRASAATRRSE
jgi:tripartite-type tricarboxylate transporter receptor subunit TctC